MKANDIIKENRREFLNELSCNNGYECATGNERLHDILNAEAVMVQEICGQETWGFSDGSYITRLEDEYSTGDSIDDFLFIEQHDFK